MDNRVRVLQEATGDGARQKGPVVFWMNRDQRAQDHWGILYALEQAKSRKTFLVVVFCLVPQYLQAASWHYRFMVTGLRETAEELQHHGIPFYLITRSSGEALPELLKEWQSPLLVTDFNPLRLKRQWEQSIASQIQCDFHQVDSHNIVPCWEASQKCEYAAYTFRPRIQKKLPLYAKEIPRLTSQKPPGSWFQQPPWEEAGSFMHPGTPMPGAGPLPGTAPQPGAAAAEKALQEFISQRLPSYGTERNDPMKSSVSGLSPYLHFGHIAPQRVALEVMKQGLVDGSRDAFLEELIVRRELSDNFCFYQPRYDSPEGFPSWALKTLNDHVADEREYLYTLEELDSAATHDELWNAAQLRMRLTGSLHGYLRMYWAKKILEWTPTAAEAQQAAISLNDRYFLDGRDPNGYTGIAWSIGGVHDRAWPERRVFGKIRYMNDKGCRRKFDVDAFIQATTALAKSLGDASR